MISNIFDQMNYEDILITYISIHNDLKSLKKDFPKIKKIGEKIYINKSKFIIDYNNNIPTIYFHPTFNVNDFILNYIDGIKKWNDDVKQLITNKIINDNDDNAFLYDGFNCSIIIEFSCNKEIISDKIFVDNLILSKFQFIY
jgi:hypothetical protein